MKKYRKVKKSDALPELGKGIKADYILEDKNYTYILATGNKKKYTMVWDKVSKFPNIIQSS